VLFILSPFVELLRIILIPKSDRFLLAQEICLQELSRIGRRSNLSR